MEQSGEGRAGANDGAPQRKTSMLSAAFKQLAIERDTSTPSTSQVVESSLVPADPWAFDQAPGAVQRKQDSIGLEERVTRSPYGVAYSGSLSRAVAEEDLARSQGRQHGSFNCLQLLGKSLGDDVMGAEAKKRGNSCHGRSELRGLSYTATSPNSFVWNTAGGLRSAGGSGDLARVVMVHQVNDDDETANSPGKKQRGSFNSLLLLEAHELSVAQSPSSSNCQGGLLEEVGDDDLVPPPPDPRDLLMNSGSYQQASGRAIIAPNLAMA